MKRLRSGPSRGGTPRLRTAWARSRKRPIMAATSNSSATPRNPIGPAGPAPAGGVGGDTEALARPPFVNRGAPREEGEAPPLRRGPRAPAEQRGEPPARPRGGGRTPPPARPGG